jgi:uncharacterized protein YqcC (DUF446 family)
MKPKIGTPLAFLPHARYPQIFRSRFGICLGPNATFLAIYRIRSDFDVAALRLKQAMQNSLSPEMQAHKEKHSDLPTALSEICPYIEEEISEFLEDSDDTFLYSEGCETLQNISYTRKKWTLKKRLMKMIIMTVMAMAMMNILKAMTE